MLDLLARVRNVCAHNERLYNYKYLKGTIDDTDVHFILKLPRKNGSYQKGKNDLFAVVIVLKYLLPEEDFVMFLDEIETLLNELHSNTKSISMTQMQKHMGFPENWKDIKSCEKIQETKEY